MYWSSRSGKPIVIKLLLNSIINILKAFSVCVCLQGKMIEQATENVRKKKEDEKARAKMREDREQTKK